MLSILFLQYIGTIFSLVVPIEEGRVYHNIYIASNYYSELKKLHLFVRVQFHWLIILLLICMSVSFRHGTLPII